MSQRLPTDSSRAASPSAGRSIAAAALLLLGAGLLVYGSWLIYAPAGFIAGGLLALAEGLSEARR